MKINISFHRTFLWILKKMGLNKREELPLTYFQLFIEEVIYTYSQFRFNRLGHREIKGKIYQNPKNESKNFKITWDLILVSFLICYILGLAKIFDKTHYGEKNTFCIYHFVKKSRFKEKREIINKINKARNEIIAHLDAKVREEPMEDGLLAGYGLTPEIIDSLFKDIFDSINEVKNKYNYLHTLDKNKNDNDVEKEFDKWFEIFKKTYGENISNEQNVLSDTESYPTNETNTLISGGSAYIVGKTGSPMSKRPM